MLPQTFVLLHENLVLNEKRQSSSQGMVSFATNPKDKSTYVIKIVKF